MHRRTAPVLYGLFNNTSSERKKNICATFPSHFICFPSVSKLHTFLHLAAIGSRQSFLCSPPTTPISSCPNPGNPGHTRAPYRTTPSSWCPIPYHPFVFVPQTPYHPGIFLPLAGVMWENRSRSKSRSENLNHKKSPKIDK